MTTFTKAKLKKSDKKTNIREYKVATHEKYQDFIWDHIYNLMSLKAEMGIWYGHIKHVFKWTLRFLVES